MNIEYWWMNKYYFKINKNSGNILINFALSKLCFCLFIYLFFLKNSMSSNPILLQNFNLITKFDFYYFVWSWWGFVHLKEVIFNQELIFNQLFFNLFFCRVFKSIHYKEVRVILLRKVYINVSLEIFSKM